MDEPRYVLEKNVKAWQEEGYVLTGETKGKGDQTVFLMKPDEKLIKQARAKANELRKKQEEAEIERQIDGLTRQIKGLQDQLKAIKKNSGIEEKDEKEDKEKKKK